MKKEEKRKSFELFREYGYHNTKVEEITKALGISKGNFYTYFVSKEEVLYEILYIMRDEKKKILEKIDVEKEPKEVLREFIINNENLFFKYFNRVNIQNIDNFLKDEKVVSHVEEIQKIEVNFIEKNIVKRSGIEKSGKYNSRFIAEFIFLSLEGFFLDEGLTEEYNPDFNMRHELTRKEKINQIIEFIYNAIK